VSLAAVSHGGNFFALAGRNEKREDTVVVYRSDGSRYGKLLPQDCTLVKLSLSDDGRRVAVLCDLVRVWDAVSGLDVSPEALNNSSAVVDQVVQMALSPDGRLLLMADVNGWPLLLDLSRQRGAKKGQEPELKPLLDRTPITSFAFSRDGRYLGLGTREGLLHVFDTRSPEGVVEVARLQHTGEFTAITFSGDGRYVAAAGNARNRLNYDESYPLRLWLLRPKELRAEAKSRLDDLHRAGRDGSARR
jgi:WD40 repeat protein